MNVVLGIIVFAILVIIYSCLMIASRADRAEEQSTDPGRNLK